MSTSQNKRIQLTSAVARMGAALEADPPRWADLIWPQERGTGVKIVYLDQNHWVELAKAAHGRDAKRGIQEVLGALRQAAAAGTACFPLSLAHWMETFKQHKSDRRYRLASVMLALSSGLTVAPPHVVVRYEAEVALSHAFPKRIPMPPPLEYLGRGLAHAADGPFGFSLDWPEGSEVPEQQRKAFENQVVFLAELSALSGTLPTGDPLDLGPLTDLAPDRRFKAGLAEWRGAAARYSPNELEQRIYGTTLADVKDVLWEVLQGHDMPLEDFALLGESGWRRVLDDMPSRKADMHMRRQWAKNAQLTPRDSDLNDWVYLGIAVAYCDVVVTEKQATSLFARGVSTRASVVANLAELPALLE